MDKHKQSEEWLLANAQYLKCNLFQINKDNQYQCHAPDCSYCDASNKFHTHGYCDGCNKSFARGSATTKVKHLWHSKSHSNFRHCLALSIFIHL